MLPLLFTFSRPASRNRQHVVFNRSCLSYAQYNLVSPATRSWSWGLHLSLALTSRLPFFPLSSLLSVYPLSDHLSRPPLPPFLFPSLLIQLGCLGGAVSSSAGSAFLTIVTPVNASGYKRFNNPTCNITTIYTINFPMPINPCKILCRLDGKSSFLLKGLEKLVDRYLRDGPLAMLPMHPIQHIARQESQQKVHSTNSLVW